MSSSGESGNRADTIALTSFQAFVEEQRQALIETVAHDFCSMSKIYHTFAPDQLTQSISEMLDVYLLALHPDKVDKFRQQVAQMLTDALDSGLTLDEMLRSTACLRQRFTELALTALEQGVRNARLGLLRLLSAIDRAMLLISTMAVERLETTNAELRRYQSIVEHAPDGIVATDMDDHLTYANPAYKALTGYGERTLEMPGRTFIDPSTLEDLQATVAPALAEEGVWHGVLFMRSVDGTVFPARATVARLLDEHGVVEGTIGLVRDIRQRYVREERLNLFEALVEHATEGVVVADAKGSIQYINNAYLKLFQLTSSDSLIGQDILNLLPPEEAGRLANEVFPALQSQGHWQGRLWRFRSDGHLWLGHHTIFELRDGQDMPGYRVAIMHDITTEYEAEIERQRLYEELQRRAVELRTFYEIAEATPDGVVVMAFDGTLTYANPAMQRMTGYGEDLVGKHCSVYHSSEELSRLGDIRHAILEHGLWQGRLTYKRKDGILFSVYTIALLVTDSLGQAQNLAGFAHDLTDQISAEQERISLQESLIATQQAMLRELSTPLIPLANGVIAMPLIGSIDSRRSQEIMETLLAGVEQHRATTALLDITGVHVVDTQVANALLRAAQAAQLLGARVILTGIRPDVAQTLVHLGTDLSGILTHGTFQSGVAYALRQ